jgi:hypothetical protein
MRLSQALSPAVWIPVHFAAGAVLNVKYRPSSVTLEEIERMRETGKDADINSVVTQIQQIVEDWDLTQDDGETKVGLDEESLRKIPTNIFREIITAAARHQNQGEAGSSSDAG